MQHNRSIHLLIGHKSLSLSLSMSLCPSACRNPNAYLPSTSSHSINKLLLFRLEYSFFSLYECMEIGLVAAHCSTYPLINYSILFWTVFGGASSLINPIINWTLDQRSERLQIFRRLNFVHQFGCVNLPKMERVCWNCQCFFWSWMWLLLLSSSFVWCVSFTTTRNNASITNNNHTHIQMYLQHIQLTHALLLRLCRILNWIVDQIN